MALKMSSCFPNTDRAREKALPRLMLQGGEDWLLHAPWPCCALMAAQLQAGRGKDEHRRGGGHLTWSWTRCAPVPLGILRSSAQEAQ